MNETTIPQPVNYIADEWSEGTTGDAWNVDPNTREPVHRLVATSPTTSSGPCATPSSRTTPAPGTRRPATSGRRSSTGSPSSSRPVIEDIARTDALTSGTPIATTRLVAAFLPHRIRATAADLRAIPRVTALEAGGRDVRLYKVPWGPAAILTPWNGPSFIPAAKVVSAIAAGCPVILKPSEHAPGSAQLVVECFVEAGLPVRRAAAGARGRRRRRPADRRPPGQDRLVHGRPRRRPRHRPRRRRGLQGAAARAGRQQPGRRPRRRGR